MKLLLVSANTETVNMPVLPLGLACVAAAANRAGHETRLLNLLFEPDVRAALRQAIADFGPEAIGISVRNIDNQSMTGTQFMLERVKGVVAACREFSTSPIILGGAGYSIFPESALAYLGGDIGVAGEGETAILNVLDRLGRGLEVSEVPGVCVPGRAVNPPSFERQLDCLPLPDPALWITPRETELWVPVQSRRGCALDCSYCSTATIEGRPVRRHSAASVVAWMRQLREAGCRRLCFVDNTFNLPPSYAAELCRAIIDADLGVELWCLVYPYRMDPELVDLMRRAGCTQISLGFESGSEPVLRSLNKRFGCDDIRTVSKMFREAGIARQGFLLLGAPGETRDTVEESLSFADELNLESMKVSAGIRIYPDTALARSAVSEGLVTEDDTLLEPRFYIQPALREWLPERVAAYEAERSRN